MICKKKIVLILRMILLLSFAASSVGMADSQGGSIDVEVKDGLRIYISQIVKLENSSYELMPEYANSGLEVSAILQYPTLENAKLIREYVKEEGIACKEAVSENGKATFSPVGKGLYLVFCEPSETLRFEPFFVFLEEDSVTAIPKVEEIQPDEISIYVLKRWNDNENAAGKRPEKITVHLLQDSVKVDSVVLSAENAWSYMFQSLDKDAVYTVTEDEVDNYRASYNGDAENGFVITNTYEAPEKDPITGDNNRVGLLLFLGGASALIIIVMIIKRKK